MGNNYVLFICTVSFLFAVLFYRAYHIISIIKIKCEKEDEEEECEDNEEDDNEEDEDEDEEYETEEEEEDEEEEEEYKDLDLERVYSIIKLEGILIRFFFGGFVFFVVLFLIFTIASFFKCVEYIVLNT